jgi:hypothetical protein
VCPAASAAAPPGAAFAVHLGMQIRVLHDQIERVDADALIVHLFAGASRPGGSTGAVDRALGG